MTTDELAALVDSVASTYGLPVHLLAAQVQAESGGDPWAFRFEPAFFHRYILGNPKALASAYGPLAACSYGLMQVMLEVAMELGFSDRPERLFVPSVGLAFGAKKMVECWKWAGGTLNDYPKALAAYNEGKGNASRGAPYADQPYIDKIMKA